VIGAAGAEAGFLAGSLRPRAMRSFTIRRAPLCSFYTRPPREYTGGCMADFAGCKIVITGVVSLCVRSFYTRSPTREYTGTVQSFAAAAGCGPAAARV
jgi:hypothetical protein